MSCCMRDAAELSTRLLELLSACAGLSYQACCAICTHTALTLKRRLPDIRAHKKHRHQALHLLCNPGTQRGSNSSNSSKELDNNTSSRASWQSPFLEL